MKTLYLTSALAMLLALPLAAQTVETESPAPVVAEQPAPQSEEPAAAEKETPRAAPAVSVEERKEKFHPVPKPDKGSFVKTEPAVAGSDCGYEVYIGLRLLGKDEQLMPGSKKIDPAKLPAGTRIFKPDEAPQDKTNPNRLNLMIDHRNIIGDAFCG